MNRPIFALEGAVAPGKRLGRALGFPTANLPLPEGPRPADGVYAARVRVDGGPWLPAILNQGHHPTFAEGVATVEIHLLDQHRDLYGADLQVEYLAFLRPEQTFPDGAALSAQIARDVETTRRLLTGMALDD